MGIQVTQNSQNDYDKEKNIEGLTFPNLQIYYTAIVVKWCDIGI